MASSNSSSGWSQSESFIPDYPQSALLQQISQYAFDHADDTYNWGMQQFNKNQGNIDALMRDALTYASPQRIAADMGMAEAGVMQAAEQGRLNAIRDLESYGIDPSSGRYAALDSANRVMAGAAAAGAGNQQRMATEERGNTMRNQAIAASLQNEDFGLRAGDQRARMLNAAMQLKYPPLGNRSQSQNQSQGSSGDSGGGGGGGKGGEKEPKGGGQQGGGEGGGGQPSGGRGGRPSRSAPVQRQPPREPQDDKEKNPLGDDNPLDEGRYSDRGYGDQWQNPEDTGRYSDSGYGDRWENPEDSGRYSDEGYGPTWSPDEGRYSDSGYGDAWQSNQYEDSGRYSDEGYGDGWQSNQYADTDTDFSARGRDDSDYADETTDRYSDIGYGDEWTPDTGDEDTGRYSDDGYGDGWSSGNDDYDWNQYDDDLYADDYQDEQDELDDYNNNDDTFDDYQGEENYDEEDYDNYDYNDDSDDYDYSDDYDDGGDYARGGPVRRKRPAPRPAGYGRQRMPVRRAPPSPPPGITQRAAEPTLPPRAGYMAATGRPQASPGSMPQMAMARGGQVPPGGPDPRKATSGGFVSTNLSPSRGAQVDDVDARLNAGEFVIPKDVAQWKGKEFFYKMIEQARKAGGMNQQPQAQSRPQTGYGSRR